MQYYHFYSPQPSFSPSTRVAHWSVIEHKGLFPLQEEETDANDDGNTCDFDNDDQRYQRHHHQQNQSQQHQQQHQRKQPSSMLGDSMMSMEDLQLFHDDQQQLNGENNDLPLWATTVR